MKIAAVSAALIATVLTVGSAEARGTYCSRHRSECDERDRMAAIADALHQAEYDRWYAALAPIDRARQDVRVEIRNRLALVAGRINDTSWQVRDIGQQAQDAVDDQRWLSILYFISGAVIFGVLGFFAAKPDK